MLNFSFTQGLSILNTRRRNEHNVFLFSKFHEFDWLYSVEKLYCCHVSAEEGLWVEFFRGKQVRADWRLGETMHGSLSIFGSRKGCASMRGDERRTVSMPNVQSSAFITPGEMGTVVEERGARTNVTRKNRCKRQENKEKGDHCVERVLQGRMSKLDNFSPSSLYQIICMRHPKRFSPT